ncbi:MAG: TIGR02301 family protein [Alphaproteobacteria bacterium]|nr:TIGR02301 family protein [Alphaproteobacteria bacterium]
MRRARFLTTLITAIALSGAAMAQQPPAPPETPEGRRQLYLIETRQLANVLGQAHYLRLLCAGRSDQSWREYMRQLLDREGGPRRTDLVDAFNAGYRAGEERFPACTPGAQTQEGELKSQGLRLADTLSARHSD